MGSRIGAITFGGISSGLPTEEIVEKLLELSRRPIGLLEKQRDDSSERLKLYQDLNSRTTALRDALRGLDNMANVIRRLDAPALPSAFEEFRRYTATSSDEDKATASVGTGATSGSLVFAIEQLAQGHRSLSGAYTSSSQVIAAGGGTLSIAFDGGTPTDIDIDANATVQDVVDAVNGAGIGASAFVVDDGQGAVRIAIVSDETGADQALTITNDFGATFTTTQTAQNARIELDPDSSLTADGGLLIESATNTFEDVIGGLTIEVKATTGASERITVAVTPDPEAVKEAIADFVAKYNAIIDLIRTQNTVDPTTNRGGPLLGDSTAVGLSQRLASAIARSYGSGDVQSSAQLGIEIARDGSLSLNEAKLEDALESDFEAAASFFVGEAGFADTLRQVADSFVDPVDGALTLRITGTTDRIADLNESIRRAEERLDTFESNLVQQFAALERTLAGFQQQSSFLTNFLLGAATQSR
jgi:flagellar hook-associated protein 2